MIPNGYIPLAAWARERGIRPDTAARAAKRGQIVGATLVHIPGTPRPVWYVNPDNPWSPQPKGRPCKT